MISPFRSPTYLYAVIQRTIYAVIPEPLSRPHEGIVAAIDSWCLKWHMRPNPKKTKSMVVNRSRTSAPGYGDLTLGGAELEELKSPRILGETFDSRLTFDIHLREVVSKAVRNLGSCAEQESNLIVHVCSKAVSMHIFVQLIVLCLRVDIIGGVSFGLA